MTAPAPIEERLRARAARWGLNSDVAWVNTPLRDVREAVSELDRRGAEITNLRRQVEALTRELAATRDNYDRYEKAALVEIGVASERSNVAEARLAKAVEALRPFASEGSMPATQKTVVEIDEHGYRRLMSPLAIARLKVRRVLKELDHA